MAYQHSNRKGVTYYLHQRERNGKTRYVFTRQLGEGALEAIPEGYEVRESVNGQVSLARATERLVRAAEEDAVRGFLPDGCQLEIKGREVIVFEPANGAGIPAPNPWLQRAMAAHLAKSARYEPVMKFELLDDDKRTFEVSRWRYSGEGGWTYPLATGPLAKLARKFLPHIGKQSFYNLM